MNSSCGWRLRGLALMWLPERAGPQELYSITYKKETAGRMRPATLLDLAQFVALGGDREVLEILRHRLVDVPNDSRVFTIGGAREHAVGPSEAHLVGGRAV